MTEQMKKKIEKFCIDNELLHNGDGIVIGVSGGADSVFLFHFLLAVMEQWKLRLHIVHINHGIRGKEALRDEQYTKELSDRYAVPCTIFRENIPKKASEWKMTEEEAGRTYRYRCFEKVRQELAFDSVAIAHHQNDEAETVLFQLLRGSSLRGLGGIRPKRDHIIRPLLSCSREEIEAALLQEHISYCIDKTNNQNDYTRNAIRNRILPAMQRDIQPKAVEHIAKSGMYLQEVMEYIDTERDRIYEEIVSPLHQEQRQGCRIERSEFVRLPSVLQKELIMKLFECTAGKKKDITSANVETVLGIFLGATGKKAMLPYHMAAERSYEKLYLYQEKERMEEEQSLEEAIILDREYLLPLENGEQMQVVFCCRNIRQMKENNQKKLCTKCFDYDKMGTMPIFRYARNGDYMWIDQKGHTKKLSRIFIDGKIPVQQRKKTPVLAIGDHVVWIPVLGRVSSYYYLTDSTEKVLCAHIANNERTCTAK